MSSWYHQSGQSSSHSKVVPCGPPGIGAWSMSLLWNPYKSNRYVFLVVFFLVSCYPAVDKVGSGRNKHTKKTNGAVPKPHRVAMGQGSAPCGPAVNSSKTNVSTGFSILHTICILRAKSLAKPTPENRSNATLCATCSVREHAALALPHHLPRHLRRPGAVPLRRA